MSKPDFCQRFLVRRNQSLIPIDQGKVGCFQKKELIYLWTSNGEKYLTDYQSLDDLEKSLNPGQFFRANRQFIIRIDSIKLIKNNHKGMELSLICGVNVDVSKEKRPLFKRWLMEGY
jgi:DNA-binding LytR/AlgR family response regulator